MLDFPTVPVVRLVLDQPKLPNKVLAFYVSNPSNMYYTVLCLDYMNMSILTTSN